MKTLIILRGLPSSGKTTYTRKHLEGVRVCSADHYFELATGSYVFDPKQIGSAHAWCRGKMTAFMELGIEEICLDNTNTQKWEYAWAIDLAAKHGYAVKIVSLFDGGLTDAELAARNAHGVPEESIRRMRARWEKDDREVCV